MTGFDIRGLVDFNPPQYLCQKCYALLRGADLKPYFEKDVWASLTCPICELLTYEAGLHISETVTEQWEVFRTYLREKGLTLTDVTTIEHARALAQIAIALQNGQSPLRSLFLALSSAKQFVHFVTWGISNEMIGALKVIAQRVAVRGVVSGLDRRNTWDKQKINTLIKHSDEAPLLQIAIMTKSESWIDLPHQKVVIVDGLLAFKGSANLTVQAWRKTAKNLEDLEAITDTERVIDLNNRLFSTVWGTRPAVVKYKMADIADGRLFYESETEDDLFYYEDNTTEKPPWVPD
ncbi:MAG: hypothetical protein JXJ20_01995 [Anaerolineae bacterium]|nr:hypothetical protein [Anaerolineae bacterium]